jgi:hypothetical protein
MGKAIDKVFSELRAKQVSRNPTIKALRPEYANDTPMLRFLTAARHKPFYRFDLTADEHVALAKASDNNCCFNHIIGLPQKNSRDNILYAYQMLVCRRLLIPIAPKISERPIFDNQPTAESIYNKIEAENPIPQSDYEAKGQGRQLAILKSTGIGMSETIARLMLFKCVYDDSLRGTQMIIITGPNISLAIGMITRMKQMLQRKLGISFDTKETVLKLNGVEIQAHPSHHIDSARGLYPSFIWVSEVSFFPANQARDVLDVTLRYASKSRPIVVYESTPRTSHRSDLMYSIFATESPESKVFDKLVLDYRVGLEAPSGYPSIFSQQDIQRQMLTPGWKREYCTEFSGLFGNVFDPKSIDEAITEDYDLNGWPAAPKSIGCDMSLSGTSNFAVTLLQCANNSVQVLESTEFESPVDYNHIANYVIGLTKRYGSVRGIFCDSAVPLFTQMLQRAFNEPLSYQEHIKQLQDLGYSQEQIYRKVRIHPVPFNTQARALLANLKWLLDSRLLKVHPKFTRLIESLKTAQAEEFDLIKSPGVGAYMDSLDSLRLAGAYIQPVRSSKQ